ncbi:alpha-l-rhamnosidase [Dysgonomonas macrotermitis]|uniref:BNR repeat-containing family member n=1 Tax=Dysgonomonas macrotermitis TaxID=1346286 RepID=A0A1M4SEW3_9BACT|nr:BNR repeat-containing protein [Dysgonomonas macrotermitis]SHE30702.1 BNR repeat-containing family member [Dysgonomonas macrotermitis]
MTKAKAYLLFIFTLIIPSIIHGQQLIPVGEGWANNSINTTVFRKNSLVTHNNTQFIAYYDPDGYMVLGKRDITSTEWSLHKSQYKGKVTDAHNSISIMVDGDGYLHVSWNHHGDPLSYAKGTMPYGLELTKKLPMTGISENNVTYPEFFKMGDGSLIFMYRDGQSGQGNLVINKYDCKSKIWSQIQNNLIDGENKRNAYWQACVDNKGAIHISWVWRETPDVATNHDLCYARSSDGGITWENSKSEKYSLPITATTAEIVCHIPQNSELINQTSMSTDNEGKPYIASYWRTENSDVPQYHVVYHDGKEWHDLNLGFRNTPFSLKGHGTKRIPISRPQIIAKQEREKTSLYLLFRDEERGEKASVAICKDLNNKKWEIKDLTNFPVNAWEPSYDTELWRTQQKLHVFVQKVEQIDGEKTADVTSQPVQVLEVEINIK